MIPLVYGDVSLDQQRGGTIISTETVFEYLARHLPVQQIMLLGQTNGVYDSAGKVIPEINAGNFTDIAQALGGSAGVDVTGGMLTKVSDMLALADQKPNLRVYIANGNTPDLLYRALTHRSITATIIRTG
jgi:isopentenyl phosphate kinase